jgi:glycerol uptake facilitator protein
MDSALIRRLSAEAVGTLILVYFGCTATVMGGVALDQSGALTGAVGFALALAIAIWLVGPISGGHVNPSVTLALAIRGRFAWADVPGYVGAQLLGGFVGALLFWATYGKAGITAGLAATHVADDSGRGLFGAFLAEVIATCLFVLVVLAVTATGTAENRATGLSIGAGLGTAILAIVAMSGASLNFARTFGPELALTIGGGADDWSTIWIYLLAPAIGAALAALAYPYGSPSPAAAVPAPRSTKATTKAAS